MKELYLRILEVNIQSLREKYPEEKSSYSAMENAINELRKSMNSYEPLELIAAKRGMSVEEYKNMLIDKGYAVEAPDSI